jgi:putative DNA primase/helicase
MTTEDSGKDYWEGWGEAAKEYHESRERSERVNGRSEGPETFEGLVERLSHLPPHAYDTVRDFHAEEHGIRVATLDKAVVKRRKKLGVETDEKQGRALNLPEPEPWPEPVNGAELLEDISAAVRRYVVLAEHAARAAALWVLHTYLLDCFLITPRLAVRSPMPRCGKTTLLDVVSRMVLRPLSTANVTASAIFRVVEKCRPTLLVDEADTFLPEAEELRGVINSGHRQGGAVVRTVGDDHEPRKFSTYGACAIALIGKLPATLHDRSVTIDLKRRLASEKVTSFRCDRTGDLDELARKAARWAADNAERVRTTEPKMPARLFNRDADNWRPLLAIAAVAAGNWPGQARQVAELCCAAASDDDDTWLQILIVDIHKIFTEMKVDRISSLELVETLKEIEGRPWAEFGKTGKPITQNKVASLLKPLGITTENVPIGDRRPKGYRHHVFQDAFARYLGPQGVSEPLNRYFTDEMRTSGTFQSATDHPEVAVQKREKSNDDGLSSGVAVQKGETGNARACDEGNGHAPVAPPERRNGRDVGLSEREIEKLAAWYENQADAFRDGSIEIDQEALDIGLRRVLAEKVLPEQVEREVVRVMERVFDA